MKCQPRIKAKRTTKSTRIEPRILKVLEATANKFDTSVSFVIAVALANTFGVKLDYNYED